MTTSTTTVGPSSRSVNKTRMLVAAPVYAEDYISARHPLEAGTVLAEDVRCVDLEVLLLCKPSQDFFLIVERVGLQFLVRRTAQVQRGPTNGRRRRLRWAWDPASHTLHATPQFLGVERAYG